MKKYFTRFMALVCCLAATLTASAQFSATIEEYPQSGWDNFGHDFSLAEVAATLDTDATTLAAALDAWMANDAPTEFMFQTADGLPTELAGYTANDRGFWMTLDGTPVPYGDDAKMYNYNSWDLEADRFTIALGQMPNALQVGDEGHFAFALVYNGKKATFDITLRVIEKETPNVEIPDPTIFISKLNIVGQKTVEVEQEPRASYASDPVDVDLEGVAALLGTTDTDLEAVIGEVLYTTTFVTENELPIKTDSLTKESSAAAPGWWFAQIYDTEQEIISDEVARAPHSSSCSFFIESFAFDAATATLSGNLGQFPRNLKDEEVRTANVYIIWGDKAYQITYNLTIKAPESQGLDGYTKVGEKEVNLEFEVDKTNYSGASFEFDTKAVLATLGIDEWKDITVKVNDGNGGVTVGNTANNGGSWLTAEGNLTSWGSNSALFFEPNASDDWSVINVGQYPGALDYETEYSFPIYFIAGENYYLLTVNVKTLPEPDPGIDPGEKVEQSEFHSVGEIAVKIQAVPDGSVYEIPMHFTYNGEYVAELVGTDSPTLFTNAAPSEDPEADPYSKDYTCTPYPGFWMSRDGYVTGWSSANSPWGATFSIADAEITFYQYPGFSDNKPGKTYKAPMYLVNEYTGAMVTFNISLSFVEEIVSVEEVGSETLILPATDGMTLDLTAAIDSLGLKELEEPIDATGLLSTPCLLLPNADGTFTDPLEATTGAYLNEQGYFDESEENAEGVFYIYFEANDENSITLVAQEENGFQLTKDKHIQTKFALQYGEKMYVFNVTFVDADTYTGVADVKNTSVKNANVFDLTGRRVKDAAQRGIFIQNGKKVLR